MHILIHAKDSGNSEKENNSFSQRRDYSHVFNTCGL